MAATRVYSLRLPDELVTAIFADQARDAQHGTDPAITLTEWLIRAARERLAKRSRSRSHRRPRVQRDAEGWPLVRVGLGQGEGAGHEE